MSFLKSLIQKYECAITTLFVIGSFPLQFINFLFSVLFNLSTDVPTTPHKVFSLFGMGLLLIGCGIALFHWLPQKRHIKLRWLSFTALTINLILYGVVFNATPSGFLILVTILLSLDLFISFVFVFLLHYWYRFIARRQNNFCIWRLFFGAGLLGQIYIISVFWLVYLVSFAISLPPDF